MTAYVIAGVRLTGSAEEMAVYRESAQAWNRSAEYAPLAALRESNRDSIRMIVDGYIPT